MTRIGKEPDIGQCNNVKRTTLTHKTSLREEVFAKLSPGSEFLSGRAASAASQLEEVLRDLF